MATIINADTSDGLKLTSDTTGEIELQSAGVTKAKVTSSGLQNASGVAITAQSGKNLIINGDIQIAQRGTSFPISTGGNQYGLDRWLGRTTSSTGLFTVSQSSDAPVGFEKSLLATVTSTYTPSGTSSSTVRQYVEGYNTAYLNWGTGNAKNVTLSFWVKSSVTGNFGGSFRNASVTYSYPFLYTISSANTWEYKTISITGATSGTWLTTNGAGIQVIFSLGTGDGFTAPANSWIASDNHGADGQVQLIETSGATWQITGVQLEAGTVATSFERLQYGQELALCQRYFQKSWDTDSAVGSAVGNTTNTTQQSWGSLNTGIAGQTFLLPVTMRATPTIVLYDLALTTGKVTIIGAGGAATNNITPNLTNANMNRFFVRMYGNSTAGIIFAHTLSAEL